MLLESTLPKPTIKPWRIIVTKALRPTQFICLSRRWINFETHWYGGHTIVCCQTTSCLACRGGVRRDYRAFVGGVSIRDQQTGIMSMTATSCDMLEKWFLSAKGLLGLRLTLTRVPKRDTGMLNAMASGYVEKPDVLTHDQLADMLSRIFSLNQGKDVDLSKPLNGLS